MAIFIKYRDNFIPQQNNKSQKKKKKKKKRKTKLTLALHCSLRQSYHLSYNILSCTLPLNVRSSELGKLKKIAVKKTWKKNLFCFEKLCLMDKFKDI